MMSNPAMELEIEEAPLALRRLWNLTRARLAGTSTALHEDPALVETLLPAQVPTCFIYLCSQSCHTQVS